MPIEGSPIFRQAAVWAIAATLFFALANVYIVAVFFSTTLLEKVAYVAFAVCMSFSIVAWSMYRSGMRWLIRPRIVLLTLALAIYIGAHFLFQERNDYYLMRDVAIGILFILAVCTPLADFPMPSRKLLLTLLILLVVAATGSVILNRTNVVSDMSNRAAHPVPIVFPLLLYFIWISRGAARAFFVAVYLLLLPITYLAGQRKSLLFWAGSLLLLSKSPWMRVLVPALLISWFALFVTASQWASQTPTSMLESSADHGPSDFGRVEQGPNVKKGKLQLGGNLDPTNKRGHWLHLHGLGTLTTGRVDLSLLNRWHELVDSVESAHQDGCLWIGCGHGASFQPSSFQGGFDTIYYVLPSDGIGPPQIKRYNLADLAELDAINNRNRLDDSNRAHHIHSLPVALFFRYGVIGALIYIIAFVRAIQILLIRSCTTLQGTVAIGFAIWIMSGLLSDITVAPFFWLTLLLYRSQEAGENPPLQGSPSP